VRGGHSFREDPMDITMFETIFDATNKRAYQYYLQFPTHAIHWFPSNMIDETLVRAYRFHATLPNISGLTQQFAVVDDP
jgi:hypothetical protein